MKSHKIKFFGIFSLISILSFGFLINQVFSYDSEVAHPFITEKALLLFDKYSKDNSLSIEEMNWVKQGSIGEDAPLRYSNHFYNPITGKGLGDFLSAKDWVLNSVEQSVYLKGNKTWQNAISAYIEGNKKEAFISLGHILHLVEDMSVPAHTRNDPHPEGDPYEGWVKNNNVRSFNNPSIENFDDISDFFDNLATYSNTYFLSKDTFDISILNKKETFIKSTNNGNEIECVKAEIDSKQFCLIVVDMVFGAKLFYLDKDIVHSDYYSLLAPKAISYAAGVIDLFFREVEKESLSLGNQNLFGEIMWNAINFGNKVVSTGEKIAGSVYSTFSNLGLSRDRASNLASVTGSGIQENPESNPEDQNTQNPPKEQTVDKPVDNTMNNELTIPQINPENHNQNQETEEPVDNNPPNLQETQQNQGDTLLLNNPTTNANPNGYYAGFGGGGGGTPDPEELAPQDNQEAESVTTVKQGLTENINPPIITIPLNNQAFTENSLTFKGTASTTNIIYSDFSKATTSADQNEDWALILEDLEQGSTTINFFASNQNQNATSTQVSINLFIDSNAPEISLTVSECQNSLSQTGCLLATATPIINAEWFSDEEDFSHFVLNQNGNISTTTATTTQISITGNQIYTLSVSAVDKMGNTSDEAKQIIEINNSPVIISEVAWAGTSKTTSSDEWIELYNNTDHEINLENWTLYSEDETPYIPLSGSIPAKGYYLLERTDDTTVDDIAADLIYTGALSNSGEHLYLALFENNATSTVDEILRVNYWNQKGSHVAYTTMERYELLQSGTNWDSWGGSMTKYILNGKNAEGGNILGTPKARNSITYLISNQGALYSDKTLTKENSPYIIRDPSFEVKEGVTLTIEEGVVIKFEPSHRTTLVVRGDLKTKGTAESPVVFTSFYDDEYGGDMNNDGICEPNNASSTSACPSAGNWKQIFIEPESKNSSFDHTIVRYGGSFSDGQYMRFKGMVAVEDTDVIIENSIFEKSMSRGLYLMNVGPSTIISGNTFRDNNWDRSIGTRYPYGLDASGNGYVVKNNLFENNVYGAHIQANSAVIDSNIFNNNSKEAIISYGPNSFTNNSGSGNGINGIIIASDITSASSTNTLKRNQLPYVIDASIATVVASSTLKIDPGVVIKFADRQFIINGNLEVNGSETEKVLFTSISDDSDGTDVQNNIQPDEISTGGISGIYFKPGSTSTIKNAEIKYMRYGVKYENSPINLQNVTFKNNWQAIYTDTDSFVQTAENIIFENNHATSTIPLF